MSVKTKLKASKQMSEPISWVFQAGESCAYCKEGLCQRMNQLMEDGYSQRKAAVIMEEESGGKWTANNIRQMFKNLMGKTLPTPKKPKVKEAEPKGGEEEEPRTEFAMIHARMAVARLRHIDNGHPDRDEAFQFVLDWINKYR